MTPTWTLLVIILRSGMFDGHPTGLLFPSMEACRAAIPVITAQLDYEYTVKCVPVAWEGIAPKRRPEE